MLLTLGACAPTTTPAREETPTPPPNETTPAREPTVMPDPPTAEKAIAMVQASPEMSKAVVPFK